MQCAKCNAINPAGARFCNQCGDELSAARVETSETTAPKPAPAAHPALTALLNLVLFWRPVEDARTADRLRNIGFVGAMALFVQSVRDATLEYAPHWMALFFGAALVAAFFLYRRWAWATAGLAAGLVAATIVDAVISSNDGYSVSAWSVAGRLASALLLANGARGLRFGAPGIKLAPNFAPVAQGFASFAARAGGATGKAKIEVNLVLVAAFVQSAGIVAAIIRGTYWYEWGLPIAMVIGTAACIVGLVFYGSPIAALAALILSICFVAAAGDVNSAYLVWSLIYLLGAALGVAAVLPKHFRRPPSPRP